MTAINLITSLSPVCSRLGVYQVETQRKIISLLKIQRTDQNTRKGLQKISIFELQPQNPGAVISAKSGDNYWCQKYMVPWHQRHELCVLVLTILKAKSIIYMNSDTINKLGKHFSITILLNNHLVKYRAKFGFGANNSFGFGAKI